MPVRNAELFLEDSIISILTQSYDDFELLILDDGSTDRSPEIAADFQKQDSRVVLITLPQSGIAKALNTGLAWANSEFIVRETPDGPSTAWRLRFMDGSSGWCTG
jgi:glycosyltransferase involved in cell wall biosynthesis